jgi:hypothetical protein
MPEILIAAATGIAIGYHLGLDRGAKRLLALIDAYRRQADDTVEEP